MYTRTHVVTIKRTQFTHECSRGLVTIRGRPLPRHGVERQTEIGTAVRRGVVRPLCKRKVAPFCPVPRIVALHNYTEAFVSDLVKAELTTTSSTNTYLLAEGDSGVTVVFPSRSMYYLARNLGV